MAIANQPIRLIRQDKNKNSSTRTPFTALPPLSLYVHFPWCVEKCPYCDFNSHAVRGEIPEAAYIAALIADITQALPQIWGRPVHTIFIGGGTPSLISPDGLAKLVSAIRALLPVVADAEITMEANPGTVEASHFAKFREAGINRLSLGVQSLNDRHLKALGRIHDAHGARNAIDAALKAFDQVNLDFMFALPGQTLKEAVADISEAAQFGATHLSAYQLTLEPNTAFFQSPPVLPDCDLAAEMQDAVAQVLTTSGYGRYEVSAYSKPGEQCRHNLNYWRFGDYLGVGAGAHGKISSPNRIVRETRPRSPQAYLAAAKTGAFTSAVEVTNEQLPFEFMMNALRLTEGVEARLFSERTGMSVDVIAEKLARGIKRGLLKDDEARIVASEQGLRFLNLLLEDFL